MLSKNITALLGVALLFVSSAFAESSIVAQTKVKNKFIVSLEKASDADKLAESLVDKGVNKTTLRQLFPQFCSLTKKNGKSPEVNHLSLLKQSFESSPARSSLQQQRLMRYLSHPQNNFCSLYVLEAKGLKSQKIAPLLQQSSLIQKNGKIKILPIYSYQIKKQDLESFAQKNERPNSLIGIISSPAANHFFLGLRHALSNEAHNNKDDDQNGYIDDRFGINSNETDAASDELGGYITLAVGKDRGEFIEYSTVDAAQAILYAIHRGASRIILPFSEKDPSLNNFEALLRKTGTELEKSSITANASGVTTITGDVTFSVAPTQGTSKMPLVVASTSSGTYITEALTSKSNTNNSLTFRMAIEVPNGAWNISIARDYYKCTSNAFTEYPVNALGTPITLNFSCVYTPGVTQKLIIAYTGSGAAKPGAETDIINLTGGWDATGQHSEKDIMTDSGMRHYFSGLDGRVSVDVPYGSFLQVYAGGYWETYPSPYWGDPAGFIELWFNMNKDAYKYLGSSYEYASQGVNLCYQMKYTSGKNASDKKISIWYRPNMYPYIESSEFVMNGFDGKNCLLYLQPGSQWGIYANGSKTPYASGVADISKTVNVTIPEIAPTPIITATKVPTVRPTRTIAPIPTNLVPTSTPTSASTLNKTPVATKTSGGGTIYTPQPTRTATKAATKTVTISATKTSAPTSTFTPIKEVTSVPTKVFTINPTKTPIVIITQSPTKTAIPVVTNTPVIIKTAVPTSTPVKISTSVPTKIATLISTPSRTATAIKTAVRTSTPNTGGYPVEVVRGQIIPFNGSNVSGLPIQILVDIPAQDGGITQAKYSAVTDLNGIYRFNAVPVVKIGTSQTAIVTLLPGLAINSPINLRNPLYTPNEIKIDLASPGTENIVQNIKFNSSGTDTELPDSETSPHYEVITGEIFDLNIKPVQGVSVVALGYRKGAIKNPVYAMKYSAVTDANGIYTFKQVFSEMDGYEYTIIPGVKITDDLNSRNPSAIPSDATIDCGTIGMENIVPDFLFESQLP